MFDYLKTTEEALEKYLPSNDCKEYKLIEAMHYSLSAGGKRVRPRLVFEFNALCNGFPEGAIPFACAVEMIHTYSLIHDDLPCMDDDDLRRGKPSNHKVYGEDIALLAGDALQTLAFEIMTSEKAADAVGERACIKCANVLAKYSGANGMVGGQVIDLISENTNAPIDVLREMDYKKTACLIKAACEMGAISAGASKQQIEAASQYGECIGIAFQIKDDILDVISTNDELGKPVGSDSGNNKSTYVSLLGLSECAKLVNLLTEKAVESLKFFSGDVNSLKKFAYELAERTK